MVKGVCGSARRWWAAGAACVLAAGGVACKEEAKPPSVVVAPAKTNNNNIRICPKCYRRFFGGQETCTVDGTALIDYEASMNQPAAHGATDAGAAAPSGAQAQADPHGDGAAHSDAPAPAEPVGQVAQAPAAAREPVRAEEPMRVKTVATPAPAYEPPPAAQARASAPPAEPAPAAQASRPADPPPASRAAPAPVEAAPVEPWKPPPADPPQAAAPPPVASQPVAKAPTPAPAPVAVAMKPNTPPASARPVDEVLADLFKDEGATGTRAQAGKLSPEEVGALTSVPVGQEERYTASRTYLAMQYKSTGNQKEYGKALEALMAIPTNQYNPTIRLEQAEYYLVTKQYQQAIDAATVAERYRQKFPKGDIYYIRLARTYEVLAKSYEGRFSSSEDPDDLDLAIRMWQRYLTHVGTKDDGQRIKMAEENIAKLERIKERVL